MAEYDDGGEDYYGEGEDYSDPNEYQDFKWDERYDYQDLNELIDEYNKKIDELYEDRKKKRKDSTKSVVQQEIDKLQKRKRFLENLQNYSKNWNPKPDKINMTKTQIGILEKELRDTSSILKRCTKPESIKERQEKIDMISKTLNLYKKSFSLIKNKSRKPPPPPKNVKRLPTKPTPTEERIPLPKEEEWSAAGEAGSFLKSALGVGWWGTKGLFKGASGAVKGIAGASASATNLAIEGGNSLYSTFRNSEESVEKVSEKHQQIDRETEERNENLVKRVENRRTELKEIYDNLDKIDSEYEQKNLVINLGIEKNNLEGEKRKEEVTRQENEKLCQEEEKRREKEDKRRGEEEKRRENEEKKRSEADKLLGKIKDLGKGISENEGIRVEEENERQMKEDERQLNENDRQIKEDTRQTFENLRQNDEKIRQELDNNRKIYWETMLKEKENWIKEINKNNNLFKDLLKAVDADEQRRQRLDKSLNTNEDVRLGNEATRLENEKDRRDNEEKRIKNENERIKNEKQRVAAEEKRITGETRREEQEQNRIDEEEKRYINEEERIANEKTRIGKEKIRITSEKQRIENELKRIDFFNTKLLPIPEAEKGRVTAEKGRKEREEVFQKNEKAREQAEKERIANEERRLFIQEQNLKLLSERKNKLDEIEMKFKKKYEKEPPKQKTFETYFTNRENSTEWIEDEKFKEKVNKILDNIDEEDNPQTYSNALLDGIEQMEDQILTKEWEKKIFAEEKEKLKWRQRINIINEALLDKNIVLTDNDPNIIEFLKNNLTDSKTIKNEELNGFFYEEKKIIKRNSQKKFVLPVKDKGVMEKLNKFLEELGKVTPNAGTIISNEVGVFADPEINREFAESYIRELREEQKELIRKGTEENGEFFEMEDFNEIGREIEDIRKNRKFKIRPKIWARSFGGFVSRFVKYLKIIFKRHFKLLIGLFLTGIGAASTSLILENFLRKAGYKISEMEKDLPKKIKKYFTKDLPELMKKWFGNYYGYYFGAFLGVLFYLWRSLIFGFTKSVVYLSADIIGLTGKMIYAVWTSFGIVAFWLGSKGLDSLSYHSYKWYEESFYMRNSIPPESLLQRRAEDENMTTEKYKQKYQNDKRFYNSTLASFVSYPISAATLGSGVVADRGKDVMDWALSWGIVAGILAAIVFFIWIIIKWRK